MVRGAVLSLLKSVLSTVEGEPHHERSVRGARAIYCPPDALYEIVLSTQLQGADRQRFVLKACEDHDRASASSGPFRTAATLARR